MFFAPLYCFAAPTPQQLLSNSYQLIVVSTPSWNAINGQLQRFTRDSTHASWKAVGKSIAIVVGKHGLGWDPRISYLHDQTAIKHEGDGLTPVGVYAIKPIFGFAKQYHQKADYFLLTNTSVCVDDVKSIYYNQLIDGSKVTQKDWNSGEQMRQVPQYKLGAMIQYNTTPVVPGAGSCIFMHIWKNPTSGTAGCIAMEESNLKQTLAWLRLQKHPIIVIFPMQIYKDIQLAWKLP